MDRWDRKTDFGCNSCMFYVPKKDHASEYPSLTPKQYAEYVKEGRCRRLAPTMKGYPVVFADDWCGEHKRGSNPVRDGKKETQASEPAIVMEGKGVTFDFVINPEEKAKIQKEIDLLLDDIADIAWNDVTVRAVRDKFATDVGQIRKLLEKL